MKNNTLQEYLYNTVRKYPNRTAISYMDHEITYWELFDKSEWLREILNECGVCEGDLVGIFMEKSDNTVAAIFSILSCDAAYIPLDSVYSPISRIISILEEIMVKVLITSPTGMLKLEKELEKCGKLKNCKIIVLDRENAIEISSGKKYTFCGVQTGAELAINRKGKDKNNIAYIFYTSGSTGKPKGVVISHQNAITFVDWCCSYFKPNSEDIFLSIAPFHFDLSVFDLYVAVASGGKLIILPPQKERNVLNYLEYIRKEQVTCIYSVPSLWNAFLRYGKLKTGELKSLKHVLFAGEVFQPEALKKAMECVPQAGFYNLYGLVETNVFTYYKVKDIEEIGDEPVPIGYVCEPSEAVIINDDKEITEIGEEGELCLCGPLVMKGYYNNRDLTKKVIRKSPIARHKGKNLFHTGDIVRLNEEGAYVLIGREDSLVKRNGFRIELGEIETALTSILGVEEVSVVSMMGKEKETVICAAVLMNDDTPFSAHKLEEETIEKIPSYMLPDYICQVDEFKRNSNGKVDREYLKQYFKMNYLEE